MILKFTFRKSTHTHQQPAMLISPHTYTQKKRQVHKRREDAHHKGQPIETFENFIALIVLYTSASFIMVTLFIYSTTLIRNHQVLLYTVTFFFLISHLCRLLVHQCNHDFATIIQSSLFVQTGKKYVTYKQRNDRNDNWANICLNRN